MGLPTESAPSIRRSMMGYEAPSSESLNRYASKGGARTARSTSSPAASATCSADRILPSNKSIRSLNEGFQRTNKTATYGERLSSALSSQALEDCETTHHEIFQGIVPPIPSANSAADHDTASRDFTASRSTTRRLSLDLSHTSSPPTAPTSVPLPITPTPGSRWRKIERVIEPVRRVFRKFPGRRKPQSIRPRHNLYRSPFRLDIRVEFDIKQKGFPKRVCRALLDPHCEDNLISRRLADAYYDSHHSAALYNCVRTLGGWARAIGEPVLLRWAIDETKAPADPRFKFPDLYMESEFHIMEKSLEYDIIIGIKDMAKWDLLDLYKTPGLVAAQGFRSPPADVNPHQTQPYHEATISAQQSESRERARYGEWHRRRHEFADTYAHPRASSDEEYSRYYEEGRIIFEQEHPRPTAS